RVLTALAVWTHYLRLLLFPLDLSSDYSPAVLHPVRSFPGAALGTAVLFGLVVAVLALRRSAPLVSLGIAWFLLTIFPVSNLVVPVGILLAERTLYLPSLGVAFVIALVPDALRAVPPHRIRVVLATACLIALAFLARTVTRNPVWRDTDAMYATLIEDHPESYRALWALAGSLEVQGRPDLAWRAFREALDLAPDDYGLLVDAGRFLGQNARWQESEALLRHAIAVRPELARAYRTLSIQLVRRGQLEAGVETALTGLARARRTSELWSALGVAHATAEDFAAAVRAQETAVALDGRVAAEWLRLAEYRDALGDAEGAGRARRQAEALGARPGAADPT
ncbi:MAG: hypothetical protein HY701_03155, partial [Gemmatimonadetes bacterium]|nr:hypothetical protein [Gemmatimonadota bacterium]